MVVLASGLGRRLEHVAPGTPKWLLPVGDGSPGSSQLRGLASADVHELVVVVSPPSATRIEGLLATSSDVAWRTVVNEHAESRNNWYSLLLGLQALEGPGDVMVLNSDLWADPAWFTLLTSRLLGTGAPAALAVDRSRGRTDEAMKVAIDQGAVTAIGKVGVEDPGGEYVGAAWWSGAAAEELAAQLRSFEDDPAAQDFWYEHGIGRHIDRGGRYEAVDVPDSRWVEIDDSEDLAAAGRLAAER